ncbi:hypothetical protein, partial [Lacrimispora defluvii]|uniref:hypothetical protein n=1 Tax=Lacrimispora defluvii TaxID=2719233 RepID=UPI001A9ACEDA
KVIDYCVFLQWIFEYSEYSNLGAFFECCPFHRGTSETLCNYREIPDATLGILSATFGISIMH